MTRGFDGDALKRATLFELPSIGTLLFSGSLFILGWWVVLQWKSPLKIYPGPVLARYTNWWRFGKVRTGRYQLHMLELHDRYGPIVRIGPNLLDIDMPEVIKTVYGSDTSWRKTEFYQNNSAVLDGKITYQLFSEIDPVNHARMKRPIVKYFTMRNVLSKEILMDKVIKDMCRHLNTSFNDKDCDLGEWIAFCAWDILGMMVFSQPFGYMDNGRDFDGTIKISDQAMDYFAAVGQMPFLDYLLDKNPIIRIGPPNLGNITRIAAENLANRLQGANNVQADVPDFLQHFVDAKSSNPEVTETDMLVNLLTTLIAGADTTAITIRTIFYYALKNPEIYNRLESEILAAELKQPASYSLSRAIPYLEATVREAMRIHPAVCMLLERYVPEPGLNLPDSSFIPAGTAIGVNPYVIGRNKKVWGPDADMFRPDRWLQGEEESDKDYHERMKLFNAADLTFGGGARVCIGRHIAYLEVYKVVATLITNFKIKLVDIDREWEVVGSWFPRQKGLVCHLQSRS
ncbi:cytochrome P450 [Xylaria cubensis]|nr:cytochrome P450 [Xylaria cubensis]